MGIGEWLSDKVSDGLGTWRFVGILTVMTAMWITFNTYAPRKYRFDEYPFVALNLFYSFIAGYTAPILLMSSKRQGEKDRARMIENLELERQDNKHIHAMLHRIVSLEKDIEDAMKMRTQPITAQPEWVCRPCGEKYGIWWEDGSYTGPTQHHATYHVDDCSVCRAHVPCTQARDYGYLRKEWLQHQSNSLVPAEVTQDLSVG